MMIGGVRVGCMALMSRGGKIQDAGGVEMETRV